MNRHLFLLSSAILLRFLSHFTACADDRPYIIGDDVSISCGSVGTSFAGNGRKWLGDDDNSNNNNPIFTSSVQINGASTSSSAIRGSISADQVPYRTARVSRSRFAYTFLVNPGQKFIRLHFNPVQYKGFRKFKDLFTVEAGPFTLLGNFSASLTADALGLSTIVKEFCMSVEENQQLNVIFSPESSKLGDTYAFINAIEIISVPSGNSYFHDHDVVSLGAKVVGHKNHLFYIDSYTALEMVHQIDFKRDGYASSGVDIGGVLGMWASVPEEKGKKMRNITWKVPVYVGFRYLVRLHFSELGIKLMAETGSVIFKVLINMDTVNNNVDLIKERSDGIIIKFKDYIVLMRGRKEDGKHDLLVSLQAYDEFVDGYGPFTGFEIFKLSNLDNSLSCPNPLPPAQEAQSCVAQTLLSLLNHRIVFATVSVTIIILANVIVYKLREIFETDNIEENKPSAGPIRFCRRFSLAEMQLATRNFSDAQVLGKGGFGKVYKGLIDDGRETVAIKRLKSNSRQGAHEFFTEIETLSDLRHINLVTLIGYCDEIGKKILVYEYMACGTLADHLYKLARKGETYNSLSWKLRLNICIGAGRGLDYLHTGRAAIHRDVKTSNILLDENFTAKVSDFGLAKHEDINNLQSHVSTKVKGTFGYLDPNYFRTGKLTRKSDTYAFGVVLLEVLCGRPAIDHGVAVDEQSLTKWAIEKIRKGEVDVIVDSNLRDEISLDSLKAFVEVVERCLDDEPKKRPTMAQVVLQLEFALEQQDVIKPSVPKEIKSDDPCIDENKSVSEQTTMTTISDPTPAPPSMPPKEQTHYISNYAGPSYGRKVGKKPTAYKPARLWPWDALWNKLKPSRKDEVIISEICEAYKSLIEFKWAVVESSTKRFSDANRFIAHGFASVYRAIFPSGEIVAVKIASSVTEFETEIKLFQKFQHQNIQKLLGYSIHEQRRILVYEFMENGSLDHYIFGQCSTTCTTTRLNQYLPWTQRFNIIMGIAQGVAYIHQDAGLIIGHGNLNPRNIFLDNDLNPKISGLGFNYKTSGEYASTTIVARSTVGYHCPEYLLYGKTSMESDVYSFGVSVLEIVSGRKCVDFERKKHRSILPQAWQLWLRNKALDLVDASIRHRVSILSEEEVLRCIKVGLLCTQSQPDHRPTMPLVLRILEGELSMELQEIDRWQNRTGEDYDRPFSFDSDGTFETDITMTR